jgi:hypothetical protein
VSAIADLKLPEKGFTRAERKWLVELIKAIQSVHAIAGRNVTVTDNDSGQVIGAEDCASCPPCP